MFLLNAFSLQMLDTSENGGKVTWSIIPQPSLGELQRMDSAIGHEDTARVLGVPMCRRNVKLTTGDIAIVAQLMGGRLPEGATTLPEGTSFKFFKIRIL